MPWTPCLALGCTFFSGPFNSVIQERKHCQLLRYGRTYMVNIWSTLTATCEPNVHALWGRFLHWKSHDTKSMSTENCIGKNMISSCGNRVFFFTTDRYRLYITHYNLTTLHADCMSNTRQWLNKNVCLLKSYHVSFETVVRPHVLIMSVIINAFPSVEFIVCTLMFMSSRTDLFVDDSFRRNTKLQLDGRTRGNKTKTALN